jgi:hypothetical protein
MAATDNPETQGDVQIQPELQQALNLHVALQAPEHDGLVAADLQ